MVHLKCQGAFCSILNRRTVEARSLLTVDRRLENDRSYTLKHFLPAILPNQVRMLTVARIHRPTCVVSEQR